MNVAIIKLCAVFAEHNLAFLLANHLISVIKEISADEDCVEIWRRMRMDRKTVPNVVQNNIARAYTIDLALKLRNNKFSILFDETTDFSQVHNACIVVHADYAQRKIVSALWEIIPTLNEFDNNHRVDAEQLYQLITNSFTERNVPLQNISAFCSDGCSVMMGVNNSVAQRFRRDNPNIIIVKCLSHSIHLCAENAMKELPGDIVKMCSSIHSFFSRSPQRQHALVEFQVHLDAEIQKILRPSNTRWLSLEVCVTRLVDQWDPLKLYFIDAFHLC